MGIVASSHLELLEETLKISGEKELKLSPEGLENLQAKVCEQYPFISHLCESVLVTDPSLPDNPIVFCNDFFQRMTQYPREEIMGRNCRFLQGKHTSKAATAKIREAIAAGRELDVQLLNYRKSGAPFWNNFLLLPVYADKNSKEVTHFIAIQKDVTYLKQGLKEPQKWGPKEVALFVTYHEGLDKPHTSAVVDNIVEQCINGPRFLSLKKKDWKNLGVTDKAERKKLVAAARQLEEDSQAAFRKALEESLRLSAVVPTAYQAVDVYVPPSPDGSVDIHQPRSLKYWNSQPTTAGVCVKIYYQGYSDISTYPKDLTYEQLLGRVVELFPTVHFNFTLKVKTDTELVPMTSNEELQRIKASHAAEARILNIYLI